MVKVVREEGKEVQVIVGGVSGYFTCLPRFNELIDRIETEGDKKTELKPP